MVRNQSRLIGYLAPIALAAMLFSQASAQKPNAAVVNAPLTLNLTSETTTVSACETAGGPKVRLNARAVSPDGLPIKYRWSTSGGKITGDGPNVTWDLTGL